MVKLSFFIALLAVVSISGHFVDQTGDHEYVINILENGTKVQQHTRFENGLIIINVPSHHDIHQSTVVIDHEQDLTLAIDHDIGKCEIYKSFEPYKQDEEILQGTANDEIDDEVMPDVSNLPSNMHYGLKTIIGPQIQRECIPERFRSFVGNHTCWMTKKVSDSFYHEETNEVADPGHQALKYGDDPSTLIDDNFSFLPGCDSTGQLKGRRTNRQVCMYPNGEVIPVDNCFMQHVTCDYCPAEDIAYKCFYDSRTCYYILVCRGNLMEDEDCLAHVLTNSGRHCAYNPCCRTQNCGAALPRC